MTMKTIHPIIRRQLEEELALTRTFVGESIPDVRELEGELVELWSLESPDCPARSVVIPNPAAPAATGTA